RGDTCWTSDLFGTIPTTICDTTPVIAPPTTQIDTTVIPTETLIIAPTIPPSLYYTPAFPDYSPASETMYDLSKDPSSGHIPPIPAVLPFLSSNDDTTESDTPDTPPSPTHGTLFIKITASTQRSPVISRRRVMILAPGQPIPYGRLYRYHPNGPVHMMTARKRVGPLPVQQLAMRHSVDHSLLDSSSRHSLSDHSSPDLSSTSAGPSRKRRMSPMTSVSALPPVSRALSPVRANLIPSPKRVRDSSYLTDVEVGLRETSLRDDVIARGSDEPHLEQDIDPEIQEEIDECFAYADALRDRGIDARVVVEAVDRDEIETGVRGLVEVRVEKITHPAMLEDIPEPTQEGEVEATYETLGDLVKRFHDHTQAIPIHRVQLMTEVYCPRNEIKKMETKLWNLTVKGNNLTAYTQRFQELILLCTRMVPDEEEKVERFTGGLSNNIKGNVITENPARLQDAICIASQLMDKKLQGNAARSAENKRRTESNPKDNRGQTVETKQEKTRNKTGGNKVTAKAYAIGGGGTNPDSNVVMGTFLLNNSYASMLFDSGADRSFVSTTFSALLDVAPSTLDTSYAVELIDGRVLETNIILRGCTLGLLGHPFNIDLMPVKLGSFDVIIGMDWLAKYHALIVYDVKIVCILYGDEVLIIRGDNCDGGSKLNIISCTKTQKGHKEIIVL
nr:reverse transcriptase domain-containing protein [Tanacetum cinerariifolium]